MKTIFCFLLLSALTLTAGELTGKWTGSCDITNTVLPVVKTIFWPR